MVLSDVTIRRLLDEGRIEVEPYDDSLMQPSSLDVRVDRYFRVFRNSRYPYIDVKQEQEELTELVEIDDETPFILHPGEFVLGSTLERVRLPDDLVARLEGKSSLGRLGLLIHSTAGFIDPGWDGHVTLELSNVANLPITIYHGDEDRAALVRAAERAGREAVWLRRARLEVPGPEGADAEPLLEELRDVRILVTGATGFVGPAVVQRLVDDGHTVRVLEHSAGSSADLPSQEAVSGSMTDPASLREAAEGQDVVVHLVAILTGKPEEFRSVMEQGTRDLLEAARGAGVQRFVLMSALGTTEETKDLVPYYGAKWQMEQDVKASGLEYVIFRPSFVFGPRGRRARPVQEDREAGAGDADRRAGDAADPADLGRRRRCVLRGGGREAGGREQDVRARRPRCGDVERVLVAPEAGAGHHGGRAFTCRSA